MLILDRILENYEDDTILIADGLDEAVIGIDIPSMRLIYSKKKCMELMMVDMEEEDALEYLEYNTWNAYVGEGTPIWCDDLL